jgi:hypothetical protein
MRPFTVSTTLPAGEPRAQAVGRAAASAADTSQVWGVRRVIFNMAVASLL